MCSGRKKYATEQFTTRRPSIERARGASANHAVEPKVLVLGAKWPKRNSLSSRIEGRRAHSIAIVMPKRLNPA
jgi:hypothetical protein